MKSSLSNLGLWALLAFPLWMIQCLVIAQDCATLSIKGYFKITSKVNGLAVNVNGASLTPGASIVQWPVSQASNENWVLRRAEEDGYYYVNNQNSGMGLNVEGDSKDNGARIVQWTQGQNYINSQWCFKDVGGGYYTVEARSSGLVLAVPSSSMDWGTQLIQYEAGAGLDDQQWSLIPVDSQGPPSAASWQGPYQLPIVPSSCANLPDGRILFWSAYAKNDFIGSTGKTWISIFDPSSGTSTDALIENTNHDMFCPGTAVLPDGRVMISGGSSSSRVSLYDPARNTWTAGDQMNIPRGYHSMTVLGDGSVLTLGGSWSGGQGNKDGEVWDSQTESWKLKSGIKDAGSMRTNDEAGIYRADNHYWLFTGPSGKVFHAGPSRRTHWIDTVGSGRVVESVFRGDDTDAMNGSAVMFDIGKILTLGGAQNYNNGPASNRAYVIDINLEDQVSVRRQSNMNYSRSLCNSVVLPSGEVVVTGGMTNTRLFSDQNAVFPAEIWNPRTGTWTVLEAMLTPRTYHSAAVLLKDGRVLTGGGGLCGAGCAANHADTEILTPPYLLDSNGQVKQRPRIIESPSVIEPGEGFSIRVDSSEQHSFALVRLSASTHAVNNDMRRIPLDEMDSNGSGIFAVRSDNNPNVMIPGSYFLFAMNADGVPSVATTVTIKPRQLQAPDNADPPITPKNPPQSCESMPEGQLFKITSKVNGLAVNVNGASLTPGASIIQWPVSQASNENWVLRRAEEDGYYYVNNQNSGMGLNVEGDSKDNGARIVQWTQGQNYINSQWCFKDVGGGYYTVEARSSGLVLAVPSSSMDWGTQLIQYEAGVGWDDQQWLLEAAN